MIFVLSKQMQSSLRLLFLIALTLVIFDDAAHAAKEYQKQGTISGPTQKGGFVEYRIPKQSITYARYGDSDFTSLRSTISYRNSVGFAFNCPGYYIIRGSAGLRLSVYIEPGEATAGKSCAPVQPPPAAVKPPTITVGHPIPTAKPKKAATTQKKPAPKLPPKVVPPTPPPPPPKIIKSNVHYEQNLISHGPDANAVHDNVCNHHIYYKDQEARYNQSNSKLEAGFTQQWSTRQPFDFNSGLSLPTPPMYNCDSVLWYKNGAGDYVYPTPNKYGDVILPFLPGTWEYGTGERTSDLPMCPDGWRKDGEDCVKDEAEDWDVPEGGWDPDPKHKMYIEDECSGLLCIKDDPRQTTRSIRPRVAAATNGSAPRRVWDM